MKAPCMSLSQAMSMLSIFLQRIISLFANKFYLLRAFQCLTAPVRIKATAPDTSDQSYERIARAILEVIERYRLTKHATNPRESPKFRDTFLPRIIENVKRNAVVHLVLPAFPFKSPNSVDKVLGVLPDKAEELALALLQGLCDTIKDIYKPGAKLTIVSDGIVYNDLLGVSDLQVWNYGEELRRMALDAGHSSIEFVRISQVSEQIKIPHELLTDLDAQKYEALAPIVRCELVSKFCEDNFDIRRHIKSDESVTTTYKGYIRFLSLDLAYSQTFRDESPSDSSASSGASSIDSASSTMSSRKKHAQRVAKQMITRGKCFAELIQQTYPNAVRLSIHASNSATKISVGILPGLESGLPMTPWHCSILCGIDGSFTPIKRSEMDRWPRPVEPVYHQGRLYCYRESSSLYDWGDLSVSFDHKYPCGLVVTALNPGTLFSSVPMDKLRELSELSSPVILRKFEGADDESVFLDKGREMGQIQKWKFGEILRVKDVPSNGGGLNNVLSSEPMPMHFDGLFKIVDGVPKPPRFQIFTTPTGSPIGSGRTLFAASRLIFQHLPTPCTLESLRHLTWGVKTPAFEAAHLTKMPLVSKHPSTGQDILRYHEHWPQERTAFDPSLVSIENTNQNEETSIRHAIEQSLYDRRVCARIEWGKGDVLVSDNLAMMHTREGFNSQLSRELWRIHVD